jgi:hypothetical protein
MRRIIILGLAVLGLVLTIQLPAQASARIQLGEIWYNSPGSDRGGATSLNHEWVQLHNTSGARITMTGWTLRDVAHHVFTFGTFTIKPHAYVKIHTGPGRDTQTDLYWGSGWYIWNNTGDTAILRDNHGHQLDKCTFPGTSQGFAFC